MCDTPHCRLYKNYCLVRYIIIIIHTSKNEQSKLKYECWLKIGGKSLRNNFADRHRKNILQSKVHFS